jgi:hypothetical protein
MFRAEIRESSKALALISRRPMAKGVSRIAIITPGPERGWDHRILVTKTEYEKSIVPFVSSGVFRLCSVWAIADWV